MIKFLKDWEDDEPERTWWLRGVGPGCQPSAPPRSSQPLSFLISQYDMVSLELNINRPVDAPPPTLAFACGPPTANLNFTVACADDRAIRNPTQLLNASFNSDELMRKCEEKSAMSFRFACDFLIRSVRLESWWERPEGYDGPVPAVLLTLSCVSVGAPPVILVSPKRADNENDNDEWR